MLTWTYRTYHMDCTSTWNKLFGEYSKPARSEYGLGNEHFRTFYLVYSSFRSSDFTSVFWTVECRFINWYAISYPFTSLEPQRPLFIILMTYHFFFFSLCVLTEYLLVSVRTSVIHSIFLSFEQYHLRRRLEKNTENFPGIWLVRI